MKMMTTVTAAPGLGIIPPMADVNNSLESTDSTTPRTFELPGLVTRHLHQSLESTIRDLRRDLEQRNAFIDHLESSLDQTQTENAALDSRVKEFTNDLRKAHKQIEISEELFAHDTAALVARLDASERDNAQLRANNLELKADARRHLADVERSEQWLDQEREDRSRERKDYQRLVTLAEERLELLATEMTRLQDTSPGDNEDQHDQPSSLHHQVTPFGDANDDALQDPCTATARDSFLPPTEGVTLADELELSSISSMSDVGDQDPASHDNPREVVRNEEPVGSIVDPAPLSRPSSGVSLPAPQVERAGPSHTTSLATAHQPESVFQTPLTSPLLESIAGSQAGQTLALDAWGVPPTAPRSAPQYTDASTQTGYQIDPYELPQVGLARRVSLRPLQLPTLAIRSSTGRSTPSTPRSPRRQVKTGSPLAGSPSLEAPKFILRPQMASTRFPTKHNQSQSPSEAAATPHEIDGDADNVAHAKADDLSPLDMSRQLLEGLRKFSENAERTLALNLDGYDNTSQDSKQLHTNRTNGKTPEGPSIIPDIEKARVDSLAGMEDAMPKAPPSRPQARHVRSEPALRMTTNVSNGQVPPYQVPNRRSSRGMTNILSHAPLFSHLNARRSQQIGERDAMGAPGVDHATILGIHPEALRHSSWHTQRATGIHSRRTSLQHPQHSSTASSSSWNEKSSLPTPTEGSAALTDEMQSKEQLIDAIASTMMGEWVWKVPRRRRPSFDLQRAGNKQRRWIWVSLEQRSIMWSSKEPKSMSAMAGSPARTLSIMTIFDVKDTDMYPVKAGQPAPYGRSIVVQTPERSLRFNAANAQRHYAWLMSLAYVANPTQMPGIPRVPSMPTLSKPADRMQNPRLRKKSLSRRSSAATLSHQASRATLPYVPLSNYIPEQSDLHNKFTDITTSDVDGLAPETCEAIASLHTERRLSTTAKRSVTRVSSLSTLQSQTTSYTARPMQTPRQTQRRGSLLRGVETPTTNTNTNYDWADGRAVADMVDRIGTIQMATYPDAVVGGVIYKPVKPVTAPTTTVDTSSYGGLNSPQMINGALMSTSLSSSQTVDEENQNKQHDKLYAYDPAKDDVFGSF